MRDARNLGSWKPAQILVLPVVLSFGNVCNTVLQNSKFCRTKCEILNACCFYSFSFIIHNLYLHYPPLFPSFSHQAPLYNKPPSLHPAPFLPCLPVHLIRVACISIWGTLTWEQPLSSGYSTEKYVFLLPIYLELLITAWGGLGLYMFFFC